jgi:cytochrome c oxidase cbb3-type subunit III
MRFCPLVILLALCPLLAAQTSDIEHGRAIFRSNCAFCHGLTGLGGRGPDLVSGEKKPDAELKTVISKGIPGTTMPAFGNFSEDELNRLVAFLGHLRGTGVGLQKATGNPENGRRMYARHGCSGCHQIGAEGSTYGPDLTRIGGARSVKYLEESILEPSADIPADSRGVTVVTNDGSRVVGVRVNEDSFTVQLRLQSQAFRSFVKDDQREVIHMKESLMPAYKGMPKTVLDDLVAYLTTLKTQPSKGEVKKVETSK